MQHSGDTLYINLLIVYFPSQEYRFHETTHFDEMLFSQNVEEYLAHCRKFWKKWEYQTTWPASWETCMQVRKQQLELDMEQQTGSK